MSAAVAAPATPKTKKVSKPKVAAAHPTYASMVKSAIVALADKKGSSKAAILKYICQNYKVGENVVGINAHLRSALKRGATSGALKQTKGTGAAGSFRLGEKKTVEKKKSAKKVKKPVAKKATTGASPKKVAKKPKAAKSPKKSAKSPKKASKSPKKAAAKPKVAKKAKSPKKAAAKPKVAKKAAAPKAPKA